MTEPVERLVKCDLCDAPIPSGERVVLTVVGQPDRRVHRRCAHADLAELAQIRAEACQQGHHRSPRQWTRDPADPYGDAMFWECVRGCGYVKRHPGYGIGKMIAAAEGALLPEVSDAE